MKFVKTQHIVGQSYYENILSAKQIKSILINTFKINV